MAERLEIGDQSRAGTAVTRRDLQEGWSRAPSPAAAAMERVQGPPQAVCMDTSVCVHTWGGLQVCVHTLLGMGARMQVR